MTFLSLTQVRGWSTISSHLQMTLNVGEWSIQAQAELPLKRDHEGLEEQVCRNHTNPPRTKPKPCMWELSIPCSDTDWGAALLKETRDNRLSVSPQRATAAKVSTTTLGCANRSAASRWRQAITPCAHQLLDPSRCPVWGPPYSKETDSPG